jgi:formylmethanofuran dehydrogenase subunit E
MKILNFKSFLENVQSDREEGAEGNPVCAECDKTFELSPSEDEVKDEQGRPICPKCAEKYQAPGEGDKGDTEEEQTS